MTDEQNNSQHDPWTKNSPVKETTDNSTWERELLSKIAMGALTEQRRARRWGIFFKLFMVGYLILIVVLMMAGKQGGSISGAGKDHTALVELNGMIASDSAASADNIVTGLRNAFENSHTKGVILRINSPGGSPVQSGYINDEIKRLRNKYPDIPLYAVVTDVCASGGYYVASAADEIYADKASMVGSIGVVIGTFGFVDAMEKLGVERRLLTAGESKGFLDPFSPVKDKDLEHVTTMLSSVHQQFINVVKEGRGDRLKDDPDLFTGLVWTGEQSLALGLIDGLGSSSYVAREIIGHEKIVDYTPKPDPFEQFTNRLGVTIAETFARITGMDSASMR